VKVSLEPTEEDFVTIHHELGHDFYFQRYGGLPILFQQGANDGFHEAIGDTIALSVTPAYLRGLGLLPAAGATAAKSADRRHQSADEDGAREGGVSSVRAPHRKWRWDVFSGRVRRRLRRVVEAQGEVSGRERPVSRTADD
jgi:peptidyl-dipeptidase A